MVTARTAGEGQIAPPGNDSKDKPAAIVHQTRAPVGPRRRQRPGPRYPVPKENGQQRPNRKLRQVSIVREWCSPRLTGSFVSDRYFGCGADGFAVRGHIGGAAAWSGCQPGRHPAGPGGYHPGGIL